MLCVTVTMQCVVAAYLLPSVRQKEIIEILKQGSMSREQIRIRATFAQFADLTLGIGGL